MTTTIPAARQKLIERVALAARALKKRGDPLDVQEFVRQYYRGVGEEDLQVSVSERPWAVEPGDVFLLCTDGLWEYVEDQQMELALSNAVSPSAWLHELEQNVLHGASHKPRHDNFTALAVWVSEPGP